MKPAEKPRNSCRQPRRISRRIVKRRKTDCKRKRRPWRSRLCGACWSRRERGVDDFKLDHFDDAFRQENRSLKHAGSARTEFSLPHGIALRPAAACFAASATAV